MSENARLAHCAVTPLVGRKFEEWLNARETPSWVRAASCSRVVESALRLAYEAGVETNAPADRAAVADTVKSVVGASGSRWPKYGAPFDEPLSMDEGDVAAHLNSANGERKETP